MQSQTKKRKQSRKQAKEAAIKADEERIWERFRELVRTRPLVSCRVVRNREEVEGVLDGIEFIGRYVKINGKWHPASKFDRVRVVDK